MPEVQYGRFAINETPYCAWDVKLEKKNMDFLNSIDPLYFQHIANIHGQMLESDERQYAAIALRSAYGHGLESLFALLCATVQAPDCVIGWLLKYRNEDLFGLVRKIHEGRPVLTKLAVRPISWETLAEKINVFSTDDLGKDSRIRTAFADLWERFAIEFLDKKMGFEYNSIKHGLRVSMGGFYLF